MQMGKSMSIQSALNGVTKRLHHGCCPEDSGMSYSSITCHHPGPSGHLPSGMSNGVILFNTFRPREIRYHQGPIVDADGVCKVFCLINSTTEFPSIQQLGWIQTVMKYHPMKRKNLNVFAPNYGLMRSIHLEAHFIPILPFLMNMNQPFVQTIFPARGSI